MKVKELIIEGFFFFMHNIELDTIFTSREISYKGHG